MTSSNSVTVYLGKSKRSGKKFTANIFDKNGKSRKVHFGATGYSDYTKHHDHARMERYTNRHKDKENWGKTGIYTAGFWSKWILWNKPSLSGSIADTRRRFGLRIITDSRMSSKNFQSKLRKSSSKSPQKSSSKSSQKRRLSSVKSRKSKSKSPQKSTSKRRSLSRKSLKRSTRRSRSK